MPKVLRTGAMVLTIAIPLQLRLGWVTVAWAVEGAMLLWAGTVPASEGAPAGQDRQGVRTFGYIVLSLAAARSKIVSYANTFFSENRSCKASRLLRPVCLR